MRLIREVLLELMLVEERGRKQDSVEAPVEL
jgi:hypothetical protein